MLSFMAFDSSTHRQNIRELKTHNECFILTFYFLSSSLKQTRIMTETPIAKELFSEVTQGSKELKHVAPKSTHDVLQEVRAGHGGKGKLNHVTPKSGQDLLQEVRAVHGGEEKLKKSARPVEKQSLLQEVRAEVRQSHLKPTELPNPAIIEEVLAAAGEDKKAVPAIAKQSLAHGVKHLKHGKTVEKQSLLSEVRKEHGGKDHLKHTVPKNTQALLSEVRNSQRKLMEDAAAE